MFSILQCDKYLRSGAFVAHLVHLLQNLLFKGISDRWSYVGLVRIYPSNTMRCYGDYHALKTCLYINSVGLAKAATKPTKKVLRWLDVYWKQPRHIFKKIIMARGKTYSIVIFRSEFSLMSWKTVSSLVISGN